MIFVSTLNICMDDLLFIGLYLLDMVYVLMFYRTPVFCLVAFIQIGVIRPQLVFGFDFVLLSHRSYFRFSPLFRPKLGLVIDYLTVKLLQFLSSGPLGDFLDSLNELSNCFHKMHMKTFPVTFYL